MKGRTFGVLGDGVKGKAIAIRLAEWGFDVVWLNSRKGVDNQSALLAPRGKLKIVRDVSEAAALDYVLIHMEGSNRSCQMDDWDELKAFADHLKDDAVIIISGSVSIGAGDELQGWFEKRKQNVTVVSSPTFSDCGTNLEYSRYPTRFILGGDPKNLKVIELRRALSKLRVPILVTTRQNAEVMMYATQSFLAAASSYMYQLAVFCEKIGADVETIARGIGMDLHNGQALLKMSVGLSGQSFYKDLAAFIEEGENRHVDVSFFEEIQKQGLRRLKWIVEALIGELGSLRGKRIAMWGEVKQKDCHGATLSTVEQVSRHGTILQIYNTGGIPSSRLWDDIEKEGRVIWRDDPWTAIQQVDALVILTSLQSFKELDLFELKRQLGKAFIVDGMNLYPTAMMKEIGFKYISIGRKG